MNEMYDMFDIVCLSVCLPACLPACLSVCLSFCMYVCVCVYVCMHACMCTCTSIHVHIAMFCKLEPVRRLQGHAPVSENQSSCPPQARQQSKSV